MKQVGRIALTMVLICSAGFAAEQTWTGRISSSMCQAQKTAMDHDCILNCIKAGAKYVFVAKGKSYELKSFWKMSRPGEIREKIMRQTTVLSRDQP